MPRRPAAIAVLLAVAASVLVAMTLPATAAAESCAQRVIDDWSKHGRLTRTYPARCLRAALQQVPEDLRDYSNLPAAIDAALQAQLAGAKSGKGGGPNGQGPGSADRTQRRLAANEPSRSLYRKAIDNLGTGNAHSLPIPLLVLASLGALLLATAAGMAGTKRIRAIRARRSAAPPPGD
jgi:hypothetical protein